MRYNDYKSILDKIYVEVRAGKRTLDAVGVSEQTEFMFAAREEGFSEPEIKEAYEQWKDLYHLEQKIKEINRNDQIQ